MAKTDDIVKVNNLLPEDVIIAIMGPTGAGKSSFINIATQQHKAKVGQKLESCTSDVRAIRYFRPDNTLSILTRYVFVDTPGFDDTNKSDAEILAIIAQWLKTTYKRDVHLAGIIYLHRISDNRMAGSPLKNIRMFAKLCGDDALCNVVLATTMWDRVKSATGEQRQQELEKNYWKGMLALGSQANQFRGDYESAWAIINAIPKAQKERVRALLLQEELVDLQRQLNETQAGMALYNQLQKVLAEHKETLRKLRDEAIANNDEQLKEALEAEYEVIQKKLQSTFTQIAGLKVSFGRRVVLFFSKKSRIVRGCPP